MPRPGFPQVSVWMRLAVASAAVVAVLGVLVLALGVDALDRQLSAARSDPFLVGQLLGGSRELAPGHAGRPGEPGALAQAYARSLEEYQTRVGAVATRTFLLQSGTSVAVFALLALVGTYVLWARVLRPVGLVIALARQIEADHLHRRIPQPEPARDGDELGELVSVVNSMLARLEDSFEAQRRFLAHAGHELRTPISVQRTLLEVASMPGTETGVPDLAARMLPVLDRQQRTVEGLLAIAAARAGDVHPVRVDVASVVATEIDSVEDVMRRRRLTVTEDLGTAPQVVVADVRLLELVVTNLVRNAVTHAPAGSRVTVTLGPVATGLELVIDNEGPLLTADDLTQLAEPFRRSRTGVPGAAPDEPGAGLGLAIARDAAEVAGLRLRLSARPAGGVLATLLVPLPAGRGAAHAG